MDECKLAKVCKQCHCQAVRTCQGGESFGERVAARRACESTSSAADHSMISWRRALQLRAWRKCELAVEKGWPVSSGIACRWLARATTIGQVLAGLFASCSTCNTASTAFSTSSRPLRAAPWLCFCECEQHTNIRTTRSQLQRSCIHDAIPEARPTPAMLRADVTACHQSEAPQRKRVERAAIGSRSGQ